MLFLKKYKHNVLAVLGVVFATKKLQGFYASSLFRFGVVGFLGTLTNLIIFYSFTHYADISFNMASVCAFAVAVTQNYLLNHFWSFKKVVSGKPNVSSYIKYVYVNIFSLLLNLLVLDTLIYFSVHSLVAQLVGILFGLSINYAGSYFFVFMRKSDSSI